MKDGFIELRTLAVRELKESHTALYIKSIILEVLIDFEINLNQVYTFTTDNGANMIKCVDTLKSEMNLSEQLFNQISNESVEDDEVGQNFMNNLIESLKDMLGDSTLYTDAAYTQYKLHKNC